MSQRHMFWAWHQACRWRCYQGDFCSHLVPGEACAVGLPVWLLRGMQNAETRRLKDSIDWKLGTFSLSDSLLHFNIPGLVGWDVVWGSSLAEQGSWWKCIYSEAERHFLGQDLTAPVLRDNSTRNDSAFPASEWKSFMFLAEGEKDDAVRFQLEFVFMHITFRFLQWVFDLLWRNIYFQIHHMLLEAASTQILIAKPTYSDSVSVW